MPRACADCRRVSVAQGPSNYTPDPSKPFAHPFYWAPFILMGNWL
jgi:CHAT domain-containing protein